MTITRIKKLRKLKNRDETISKIQFFVFSLQTCGIYFSSRVKAASWLEWAADLFELFRQINASVHTNTYHCTF